MNVNLHTFIWCSYDVWSVMWLCYKHLIRSTSRVTLVVLLFILSVILFYWQLIKRHSFSKCAFNNSGVELGNSKKCIICIKVQLTGILSRMKSSQTWGFLWGKLFDLPGSYYLQICSEFILAVTDLKKLLQTVSFLINDFICILFQFHVSNGWNIFAIVTQNIFDKPVAGL